MSQCLHLTLSETSAAGAVQCLSNYLPAPACWCWLQDCSLVCHICCQCSLPRHVEAPPDEQIDTLEYIPPHLLPFPALPLLASAFVTRSKAYRNTLIGSNLPNARDMSVSDTPEKAHTDLFEWQLEHLRSSRGGSGSRSCDRCKLRLGSARELPPSQRPSLLLLAPRPSPVTQSSRGNVREVLRCSSSGPS
jgi:hypothetical protein